MEARRSSSAESSSRSAEDELTELRRQHEYLLTNLPGVVYRCEPKAPWRMAFVSDKVVNLTGFRASAFLSSRTWAEIIHPADLARVQSATERALERRRKFTVSYRILDRSGAVRWVREQGQGVYEEDTCIWLEGFITEVTEQKLLKSSVREAEAEASKIARQLADVLESTSDCVYALDSNWRITYMNGHARTYFAADDEMLGRSIFDLFPDGRHSDFSECFRVAMEERQPASAEGFLSSRGRWYEVRVTPRESGLTVFFRDISDRKASEEAQRTSADRWRATLDVIPQMVWSMAADAKQPDFYNARWYEFTGLPTGSNFAQMWESLIHPDDREVVVSIWTRACALQESYEAQYRIRHHSGDYRWIIDRSQLEKRENGEPLRWYGTYTDVHERVLQQQELAQSERRVQRILRSVPQVIWSTTADGELDFISNQELFYRDCRKDDLSDGRVSAVHPDDRQIAREGWAAAVASGKPYEGRYRVLRSDGEYRWTLVRALPERDDDGKILRWYGTSSDIHDEVLVQVALRESESLNRGIIEASPDCVWLLDRGGEVLFVNKATVRSTGVSSAADLIGQRWGSRLPEVNRSRAEVAISQAQSGKVARLVLRSGRNADRWMDVVVAPVCDDAGSPVKLVVISRDVTEQKLAEENAQWAANHDPLTHLPNRFLLQHRLDREIERAKESGGGFALMMLDVDHLKRVNDGLGHDAGDALLVEFATRVKSAVREEDTVARLGGDEFAVILWGVRTEAEVEAAANAITTKLAQPFAYQGRMLDCHASIGVSLFPRQGADRLKLMKNADVALYVAKSSGRGGLKMFEPVMRQEMQTRSSMLSITKDALKNDWILPHYQPKVDLLSGATAGYEALLRWRHPRKGVQLPSTIAAAFEDPGVAAEISDRMIAKVIDDVQRWLDQGVSFKHVAINAAAAEFRRGGFAETVLERLAAASVPTSAVQLEVTEAVFLGRGAECVERALKTLSQEGVRIALDDFGTGYASLSHLKQFPVDIIKIDQSFVRDLGGGGGAEAIIRAVINLGESLDIEVVAEGIESASQHDFLVNAGCRYGQGFLYGRATACSSVEPERPLRVRALAGSRTYSPVQYCRSGTS